MLRNGQCREFVLVQKYCIFAIFRFNTIPKELIVSCDYYFCFSVSLTLVASKANTLNIKCLILKYAIHWKDKHQHPKIQHFNLDLLYTAVLMTISFYNCFCLEQSFLFKFVGISDLICNIVFIDNFWAFSQFKNPTFLCCLGAFSFKLLLIY